MRYLTLAVAAMTFAAAAAGADHRDLEFNRPAAGIQSVELQVGVGDVSITADPADVVAAHVEVSPKRSHLWGSSSSDLDSLEISGEMRGDTLVLRLKPSPGHDVEFGEDWTVRLPARLALRLKVGVGDVRVVDMAGDVVTKVGVGDVRLEGTYDSFGDIHSSCGVGDATLRTPAGRNEGEGFIAHTLKATGPGKAEIRIEAGVGDVTIHLR
jgi:hypothetical protein